MSTRSISSMLWSGAMLVVCIFNLTSCCYQKSAPRNQLPLVTIWAWDAPCDLRFLESTKESVAMYAGTIVTGEETAYLKPNTKECRVPADQRIFPVFRIESRNRVQDASVDAIQKDEKAIAQIDAMVDIVSRYLAENKQPGAPTVQIDFDATLSERNFYRVLLKNLRLKLGRQVRISVTALASWCLGDRWLSHEDVDEAVVMLFSMGEGQNQTLSYLQHHQLFAGQNIELAVGVSANEARTNAILLKDKNLLRGRHLYLFNSFPWTEKSLRRAEKELCTAVQN